MSPIFARAFFDSLEVFGTTLEQIGIALLIALVTALIVFWVRGYKAFKTHVAENVLIAIAGPVAAWLLVFVAVFTHLPYKMLREADSNLAQVILEKQQLNAENNGLRATNGSQQSIIEQLQNDVTKPSATAGKTPPIQINVPSAPPPTIIVNPEKPQQRNLSATQHDQLVATLKANPPFSITIMHADGDFEAQTYGDYLSSALKDGGWTINQSPYLFESRQGEGVKILVRDVQAPPLGAVLLQNALKAIGIDAEGASVSQVPDGQIWLYIGVQD